MSSSSGYIKEIFESIQGEGKYIGAKQLFVRFAGCSVKCLNCDTDFSYEDFFKIKNKNIKNPVSAASLINNLAQSFDFESLHSISITGGEPLDQFDFLKKFISILKKEFKVKIFLETSGFYPEKLLNIKDIVDIFSIDLKIKSSFGLTYSHELQNFFKSVDAQKYYVKLIINKNISENEMGTVTKMLLESKISEIYLQPLNNFSYNNVSDGLVSFLQRNGIDAFFIPQLQKFMEIK